MKKERKLTPKQERFVQEYLLDLNATQAAIRAGYAESSAGDIGAQLLGKTHIKAAINAAQAERARETRIDAAWLLTRLADEATADVSDLYDENGDIKPVRQWPKIWRQGLVQGIDIEATPDGVKVKKLRVSDRVKRLELIGKHIGVKAFEERVSVSGLEGLAERLKRAAERGGEDE